MTIALGTLVLATVSAPLAQAATPIPDPAATPATTVVTAATPTPTPAPAAPATSTATCTTDPKAPWRLMAQRDPNDAATITIDWVEVACATRYNVSVFVDGKDSVTVVDGTTTKFTVPNTDTAKTYQIQVSSRNDAGRGGATPVFYLRPAVPGGVTGMKIDYTDVSVANLVWNAPIDRAPISYHLVATRVADQKLVVDQVLDGTGDIGSPARPGRSRHLHHHASADQQVRLRAEVTHW